MKIHQLHVCIPFFFLKISPPRFSHYSLPAPFPRKTMLETIFRNQLQINTLRSFRAADKKIKKKWNEVVIFSEISRIYWYEDNVIPKGGGRA